MKAALIEMIETKIMTQASYSNILRMFVAAESLPGGLETQWMAASPKG